MTDALFAWIEKRLPRPVGDALDAGTGTHSLGWMRTLAPRRLVAVTADPATRCALEEDSAGEATPRPDIHVGTWTDPDFLAGETFDLVVADYLVGAVEGFAPYAQEDVLARLAGLLRTPGTLYVVGWDPFPPPETRGQHLVHALWELKCAAWRLAGTPPYREYALEWVAATLARVGLKLQAHVRYTNIFHLPYFETQTRSVHTAAQKLRARSTPWRKDEEVAQALSRSASAILEEAARCEETHRGIRYGADYVIEATP